MLTGKVSRREFVLTAATPLVAVRTASAWPRALTAQQVVERIRANVGVPWRESSADGFKAGDPTTLITGVAAAVMVTMDVLRSAAVANLNLVVTQEPTFYTANDNPGPRESDPVYIAKKAFIDERKLVIWRFGDHWNARRPSESVTALAAALGWTRRAPDNELIYQVPDTTFGALTAAIRSRLGVRGGIRTVGRTAMPVRSVFLSPGTTDVPGALRNLPQADVILAGEPREWEAVPYVLDCAAAGREKGMISLGRLVSQAPGMRACATWIHTLIPEIPAQAIPVADPYWSPRA